MKWSFHSGILSCFDRYIQLNLVVGRMKTTKPYNWRFYDVCNVIREAYMVGVVIEAMVTKFLC